MILLPALNGISPSVLRYALELEQNGYRVTVPSLYGDPIQGLPAYGWDDALAAAKFLVDDPRWNLYGTDEGSGPILEDVRAIVRAVAAREGRNDLVVIGNCLTGSFGLSLIDEPSVRTAVLAQPAMPLKKTHQVIFRIPQRRELRVSTGVAADQWEKSLAALRRDPRKKVIGFHYRNDPLAPLVKFDTIHERLAAAGVADRFTAYILDPMGGGWAKRRADWVVGGETDQQTTMLTPHSTLINPVTRTDRDWFRARLLEALREG